MGHGVIVLFLLLLLVHIIFDFYLQTEVMVREKSFDNGFVRALKAHLFHAAMHGFFLCLSCFAFIYGFLSCTNLLNLKLFVFLLILFTLCHFLTDVIKSLISLKIKGFYSFFIFLIDQVFHILTILFVICYFFNDYGVYIYDFDFVKYIGGMLVFACAIAFLLKPSSIIVYLFFKSSGIGDGSENVKITKSKIAELLYAVLHKDLGDSNIADYTLVVSKYKEKAEKIVIGISNGQADINISSISKVNNAGRFIGYLERLIIFLFLILGSVTAVVAVLAMKTALRFSDLKDDNDSGKAEYIMIGTFFSLIITVIISMLARMYLIEIGIKINDFS
ncbi:DUF3307 domain-containing protein [Klebsiella pneumoniae]|uniref:DUF3307 domain-containing protein n=1 Tax=Neisseria meningitidis TaxID=487 RepID=UPI001C56E641|nr:DUF3307 domain-containing protein [Neisseria meningitidis]MBW3929209.1 DUF3307 domain-containing protein [Neisseria meningitidis]